MSLSCDISAGTRCAQVCLYVHRELLESLKMMDYSALEVRKVVAIMASVLYPSFHFSLPPSTLQLSAAYGLLHFVMHTQRSILPYMATPSQYSRHHHMAIDANTRRALELVRYHTPLYCDLGQ